MRTLVSPELIEKLFEHHDLKTTLGFLRGSDTFLKGMDIYCFRFHTSMDRLLQGTKSDYQSFSLVHPIPRTTRALWITIAKWTAQNDCTYDFDVIEFDLIKTAGDPVDCAVLRGEKLILDVVAGETVEQIKRTGLLRDRKKKLHGRFTIRTYHSLLSRITARIYERFSPQKRLQKQLEKEIVRELDALMDFMRWCTADPAINHFKTRSAINY